VEVAAFDPLGSLKEDYASAVLHLTWAVNRKNGSRTLLAGAIELLPTEVPPPEPGPERFDQLSQRYVLYARDVVEEPERALTWFEQTAVGRSVRPNAEGELVESNDPKATFFVLSALSPEPPPPALVTPTTEIPFCADWHGRPRARHLIAQSDPSLMFTPAERSKAASWLERELHLDLDEFPEFWGSVHLLAPNPVFRAMRVRADGEKKNRSGLVLTFVPRTGRSVEGLTLMLEEERPTGLGVLFSATLDGPIVRVPMPAHPGSVRARVIDPKRGVVLDAPFRVFDVGFNLTTRLSSQNRRVAPTRAGETGYEIPLFSSMKPGVRAPASGVKGAGQVLAEAAVVRRQRARGAHGQRWFRDRTRPACGDRILTLSADAHRARCDFQGQIEPRLAEDGDLMPIRDWAGKLTGTVCRLAAILHVGDHAHDLAAMPPEISGGTFDRAAALGGDYFLPHARAAFRAMGADESTELAKRVWAWARRRSVREFSERDALRAVHADAASIKPALIKLCERGLIREHRDAQATGGRPASPRYEVRP